MTPHQHILDTYGSIAVKSGEMLDAAKSSDWVRLIALEQDCRALAETLRRVDKEATHPDVAYLQRKAELIQKILADDAEIRKFTEPWMNQLAAYLGNARQQYRLQRAYETDHGS
jgi:flagellar protein FliT